MKLLRPSLVLTAFLLVLCCAVYPALVTGAGHALFRDQADGSLIRRHGVIVGSRLLGQTFADPSAHPEYFWGRLSSASVDGATGVTYSSGSNDGPLSSGVRDAVSSRVALLRASGVTGEIPIDLVTRSASGLDPDISPAAAEVQISRVARARHVTEDRVRALVRANTEGSTLGLMGEPRVHVLPLNLALDAVEAPPP